MTAFMGLNGSKEHCHPELAKDLSMDAGTAVY
jgi:hypothetical protein